MPTILRKALFSAALLGIATAAQAAPITFATMLSGPTEFPANASPGTGLAIVDFDIVAHTLRVRASFSGLTGTTAAAHIHCCVDPSAAMPTASVATMTPSFTGFPLGVLSGSMDQTFDTTVASSFRAGFITGLGGGTVAGAEAALHAGLLAGAAYFNIHTSTFPGGEIRGFLAAVPEPSTLSVFGIAFAGLAFGRRKKAAT